MSPREALATVLRDRAVDEALAALDAAGLVVVERGAVQDLDTGRAIRELREALPERWVLSIIHRAVRMPGDLPAGWTVEAWDPRHPAVGVYADAPVPVLAEAADACRQRGRRP